MLLILSKKPVLWFLQVDSPSGSHSISEKKISDVIRQILQNKVQNLRRDYLFVITDSPF